MENVFKVVWKNSKGKRKTEALVSCVADSDHCSEGKLLPCSERAIAVNAQAHSPACPIRHRSSAPERVELLQHVLWVRGFLLGGGKPR